VANAWAAPTGLEGTVRDSHRQPVRNADVRIEGKDFSKTVKTDGNGHYACTGLAAGNYHVTLLINAAVKASIKNASTKLGESTRLNFDLKDAGAADKSGKKATHMVYVPAETGSHIGGRWVEVDDNGTATTAGADNVEKVGGGAVRQIQTNAGPTQMGGGSH
jgi:hypothetical protein